MSFYIEKIIVTGSGKHDSIIELQKGTNIIYGPSNTGKSCIIKCIDYMFGSERIPIDTSTGYEIVKMVVNTYSGTITMSRKIGENNIQVDSTDDRIPSGKYKARADKKNHEKTINWIWLLLIGIKEMHLINSNKNFGKQILSWRTFFHMFFLSETKIISENSAILSMHSNADTAVISSLLFLLSGKDFGKTETKDSKEVKEAKKNAVKEYINKELFRLSERNQELLELSNENGDIDLTSEIEQIMAEITECEKQISQSMETNKKILFEMHEKNESLAECSVLSNRYIELNTQYEADLKRLSFIVDGEANMKESASSKCPFCDGKLAVKKSQSYIDAAKADYKKIILQAKDLGEAAKELDKEMEALQKEINELQGKKTETESIIETELKPQLSSLKEKLLAYRATIERKKEMEILKKICEQKNADIVANEEDDDKTEFKVKEYIGYDFVDKLSKDVKAFLESCKFENLLTVSFNKADMDIVVNGKKKSSNGKGYNAYFNSVVAIVLSRYMNKEAKYSPDFLVLDSPILSLKETDSKKPSDTMRNTLFENIISSPIDIQTIVVENEIPNINYGHTKIIHFTKELDNGRYGFLTDVID